MDVLNRQCVTCAVFSKIGIERSADQADGKPFLGLNGDFSAIEVNDAWHHQRRHRRQFGFKGVWANAELATPRFEIDKQIAR